MGATSSALLAVAVLLWSAEELVVGQRRGRMSADCGLKNASCEAVRLRKTAKANVLGLSIPYLQFCSLLRERNFDDRLSQVELIDESGISGEHGESKDIHSSGNKAIIQRS